MPVEGCKLENGGSGYKWGSEGHCYKNRKDAIRQGVAIELSKKKDGKPSEFDKTNSQISYEVQRELSFVEQLSIHAQINGINTKTGNNDQG